MIDYSIIDKSIGYYEGCDFRRIEAPWTVSPAVNNITKPDSAQDYVIQHTGKCLVGSGEQSFLYLYLKDFLPKGKFQTITPCFRDELFDWTHSKYFIKNELIDTLRVTDESLLQMVEQARRFFGKYFKKKDLRVTTTSKVSMDIEVNVDGVWYELGSYGIRSCEFLEWIYGTACAEPRLSKLYKRYKYLEEHGISQDEDTKG